MKKMILASIVTVLATVAMADIPNMGGGSLEKDKSVTTTEITGATAEAIYESINSEARVEASLRTMAISYKVLRAADGMDQVICHKTVGTMGRKKTTYNCTTESSNTDKPLKVVNIPVKMG